MTFAELQDEFKDRGYHYVDPARYKRWLNQAYLELCESDDWPFLETETSSTAPLTISDLRQVLYVYDSTNDNALTGRDQRTMHERDPDLTATGNPENWYLEGTDTLNVWPPNTDVTIQVRYLEVPDEMSDDSDEPVVPSRFQNLIVDGAVIRALRNSEEYERAQILRNDWDLGVMRMAASLMDRNRQNPDTIVLTTPLFSRNA